MKKLFSKVITILLFVCIFATTVACGKKSSNQTPQTPDETPSTEQATAFEVMAKATEKLNSTNSALNIASVQEELPEEQAQGVSNYSAQGNSSVGTFRKATIQEYMARQQFVSYVFYNVSYALQSCKKENGYNENFKLGKTFYGSVTNTPDDNLNTLLEQTQSSTTIAVKVSQEIDGISFVVDWDMRHPYLEENMPIYNTVYMVNGYIRYNYLKNEVRQIILNTYQTEKSGQFFVSKINYETNSFVYIEGYRTQVWDDFNSQTPKTSLDVLYNNGTLSYEKICEYPFNGLFVGTGNISNNINNVNFKGYWKFCVDINDSLGEYNEFDVTEEQFETFYNLAYGYEWINNKIFDVKIRNSSNMQELTNATEVDFMEDAVTFGTNKTTCIFIVNENDNSKYDACVMPFIEYEDFKTYLNQIITLFEADKGASQEIKNLAQSALEYLNGIKKDNYIGELGSVNNQDLKLVYVTPESSSIRWNTCMTKTFNYQISNGVSQINFVINDGEVEIL